MWFLEFLAFFLVLFPLAFAVFYFLLWVAVIGIGFVACLFIKDDRTDPDWDSFKHSDETLSQYLARRASQIDAKNRMVRENVVKKLSPKEREASYMPPELRKHLGVN